MRNDQLRRVLGLAIPPLPADTPINILASGGGGEGGGQGTRGGGGLRLRRCAAAALATRTAVAVLAQLILRGWAAAAADGTGMLLGRESR